MTERTGTAPPAPAPARDPRGHKGVFGAVCVVGGAAARGGPIMIGGPALAALAALRTGAGLAKLAMPAPLLQAGLTIAPAATGVALPVGPDGGLAIAAGSIDLLDADALAVGPGLGAAASAGPLVSGVLGRHAPPVVLDADGLNLLAAMTPGLDRFGPPTVLTPHVGEHRRLARAYGVDADPLRDPPGAAGALAERTGGVVVLKSAVTAVAGGGRTWTHEAPNPALATAGSGDVLTGVIASLIAQFGEHRAGDGPSRTMPLFELACLGVAIHASAGAAWRRETGCEAGMLAGDLVDRLPAAMQRLRSSA